MNILLDVSVLEIAISGIGHATLGFYEECARLAPQLKVTGIHRRPLSCVIPDGIRSVQWGSFLPRNLWRNVALPLYYNINKPDVIHFPWNNNAIRPNKSALVVLTIHDVIPLTLPYLYLKTELEKKRYIHKMQTSINNADLILTDSVSSRNDIVKYFKTKSEPLVIYLANTLPLYENRDHVPSENYFVYLGGYEARKGLDQLVKVFVELFESKQIMYPLVLIGYPNHFTNDLHSNIEKGKSIGAIFEKGYLDDSEIATLLRGARALIYPSRYEGFGFPPLEAMSQGCPVITTNVSSLPEVCGDAAIYVTSDNDVELVAAILEIDSNDELRRELRLKGPQRASTFTWERSARLYLDALDGLLSKRTGHKGK